MLMVLSPAKSLVEGPAVPEVGATQPALLDQAEVLMETLRGLTPGDLRSLMSISDTLAARTHAWFQTWETPFTRANARQAALMFDGDVYKGLDAPTLSPADLAWAQERVAILSGLYGVLRPLDLIQPYRLEMGTKLATPRGTGLYAFWGDRIAVRLREQLAGDRVVVNLASKEYFSAVDREALGARVVTPVFKDVKDGKARTLAFFAKRARGAMVRWAIDNRVDSAQDLTACEVMGYRFAPDLSTEDRWEFRRVQPPPAGA